MFRRRTNARVDGVKVSRVVPDRAVHTAENFVRRAWALELARQRGRREFALHIERENLDAALALLAAAQRDGDPRLISAARTMVLQALDDVRVAVAARDEARRIVRKELRLSARKPKKLEAAVAGGRPEDRGALVPARDSAVPDNLLGKYSFASVIVRPHKRRHRTLRLLVRRWTRGLHE
jgi:hypothetical protein